MLIIVFRSCTQNTARFRNVCTIISYIPEMISEYNLNPIPVKLTVATEKPLDGKSDDPIGCHSRALLRDWSFPLANASVVDGN